MKHLKKLGLAFALAGTTALTGCGGGGGGSSDDSAASSGTGDNGTVSGTASAPAGAVAMLEPQLLFDPARLFFISPAAAAITGLQPVTGATVELVRIDNNGQQVGDVLATTTTSTTGEYTLTLPAGVDLSGNLIVRISGSGGTEMRAQVVERSLDITPVSEFVLQHFVTSGANLENLSTTDVAKLSGQVEDFDVAAGADMTEMLTRLEQETGDFVDASIDVITTTPGDASTLAGSYRSTAIELGLHDDDGQYGVGTFGVDFWSSENISFTDNGNGNLAIAVGSEEDGYSNLNVFNQTYTLKYFTELDNTSQNISTVIADDGVLNIQSDFSEEIDGDSGWRWPPSVTRYQKAKNSDAFIAVSENAAVRYSTIDTNNDQVKDAIDPAQRQGDEVFRALEFVVKKPTNADVSDMTGNFGRIYLGVSQYNDGLIEIESERNVLTFDGAGSLDMSSPDYRRLESNGNGTANYVSNTGSAASGVPFTISADGDIPTVGGNNADGFVNEDFDLLVFNDIETTDDSVAGDDQYQAVHYGTTVAVKLPGQLLDITGKTYRVLSFSVEADGSLVALHSSNFDTTLAVPGLTAGQVTGKFSSVVKTSRTAEVTAEQETIDQPAAINLAADGSMTLTITDTDGTTQLQGYLNHDGSLAVLQSSYTPNGGTTSELGLVMLMEI